MISELLASPDEAQRVTGLSYRSPFADLDSKIGWGHQTYLGTLDQILHELQEATRPGRIINYPHRVALHPPRIIRAALDYKIANPESLQALDFLNEAIKVALGIYKDPNNSEGSIEGFKELAISVAPDLLDTNIFQPADSVTWSASSPERSSATAAKLAERNSQGNLLFIALAHGGVAAGMDVFLRYQDLIGQDTSEFYVVRFSRYKSKDEEPRLSPHEIAHLHDMAFRRQVLIFDEDSASGATLAAAQKYFAERVFPGQNIQTLANLNALAEITKAGRKNIIDTKIKNYDSTIQHEYITDFYKKNILGSKYSEILSSGTTEYLGIKLPIIESEFVKKYELLINFQKSIYEEKIYDPKTKLHIPPLLDNNKI